MRRALEWLGGSVLVYVLLAACAGASGERPQAAAGSASGPDGAAAGGVPTVPAGGKDSATGGMLDPVPPALAAGGGAGPVPAIAANWESFNVACDSEQFLYFSAGYAYGERLFPGRTAADLARTVVLYRYPDGTPANQRGLQPPGYEATVVTLPSVRDGAVAATCAASNRGSFTFLVPPPL